MVFFLLCFVLAFWGFELIPKKVLILYQRKKYQRIIKIQGRKGLSGLFRSAILFMLPPHHFFKIVLEFAWKYPLPGPSTYCVILFHYNAIWLCWWEFIQTAWEFSSTVTWNWSCCDSCQCSPVLSSLYKLMYFTAFKGFSSLQLLFLFLLKLPHIGPMWSVLKLATGSLWHKTLWDFDNFLIWQNVPGSSCTFLYQGQELAIALKSLNSFSITFKIMFGRNVLFWMIWGFSPGY